MEVINLITLFYCALNLFDELDIADMGGNYKIGLKPLTYRYSITPCTKMNGNTRLNLHCVGFLQEKSLSQFICLFNAVKYRDVDRLSGSKDLSASQT